MATLLPYDDLKEIAQSYDLPRPIEVRFDAVHDEVAIEFGDQRTADSCYARFDAETFITVNNPDVWAEIVRDELGRLVKRMARRAVKRVVSEP